MKNLFKEVMGLLGKNFSFVVLTIGVAFLVGNDLYFNRLSSAINTTLLFLIGIAIFRFGVASAELVDKAIFKINETHRIAKDLEIEILIRRKERREQAEKSTDAQPKP